MFSTFVNSLFDTKTFNSLFNFNYNLRFDKYQKSQHGNSTKCTNRRKKKNKYKKG